MLCQDRGQSGFKQSLRNGWFNMTSNVDMARRDVVQMRLVIEDAVQPHKT